MNQWTSAAASNAGISGQFVSNLVDLQILIAFIFIEKFYIVLKSEF